MRQFWRPPAVGVILGLACVAIGAVAGVARAAAPVAPPSHGVELHGRMEPGPTFLTADERRARATLIREAAAQVGMTNGVLLAGIAEVETTFAHCWSEATWACQGPPSPSCDGGPVIAGSADGPCSAQQGGLGMFQFDSGTFSDTVATYGETIVTVEGNTAAVVPFLVTRAIESIDGVTNEAEALAWMNAILIVDDDPEFERWVYFVSWRYNGCRGCTTQENKYRNGTHKLYDEMGPAFWEITEPPACFPGPCGPDGGGGGVGIAGEVGATGGCAVSGPGRAPRAPAVLLLVLGLGSLIRGRRRAPRSPS